MHRELRILAVVPARGGSKGIPLKNLRTIRGVSLVGLAGRVVSKLTCIDRAIVSTDHDAIAAEALRFGLDVPFRRSPELSGDRISDWQVLNEALRMTEEIDGQQYDVVLMLQPTSPLRTPEQVMGTLDRLIDGNYDAVWSVSETDTKFHPLKQLVVSAQSDLDYYDPAGSAIIARQQLVPTFHRNGVAYAVTRDCVIMQGNIRGRRLGAYVVDGPVANIDVEEDLIAAEAKALQIGLTGLSEA
jgi:CMP-N,N'-diacetyllegionaminic acid synthase